VLELLFRKHFWVVHATGLAVVAFLLAATVNHGAGFIIANKLSSNAAKTKKKRSFGGANASNVTRNFANASEQNIFDGKREVLTSGDSGPKICRNNNDCPGGTKCMRQETPGDEEGEPVKTCQADEDVDIGDVDCGDAPVSTLPLQLIGTSVWSTAEYSLASIIDQNKGKSAAAEVFSVNACVDVPEVPEGDVEHENNFLAKAPPCNKLPGDHKVVQILIDAVCIVNNEENRFELITLEEPPEAPKVAKAAAPAKKAEKGGKNALADEIGEGITKTGANSYEVKQESVNKVLGNLSKLATQARIVPAFEGGEAIGFKLFSIRPGSLYSKIGIQNGDVIQKVNGYDLNSPDKALELYQKLKDGKEFAVDIKRRGKNMSFDYRISK